MFPLLLDLFIYLLFNYSKFTTSQKFIIKTLRIPSTQTPYFCFSLIRCQQCELLITPQDTVPHALESDKPFRVSRQNTRKRFGAGNYIAPISPNTGILFYFLFYFFGFFAFLHEHSLSSSSSGSNHVKVSECGAVMASHFHIRYLVHSISILHLIIIQTNSDTWFQPSSLCSIIETKFPGLSSPFPISSIDRLSAPVSTPRTQTRCAIDHDLALHCNTSKQNLSPYQCNVYLMK